MVSISGMMYVHHRNTWKECVWGEFYIGHNSPNDFWAFDFFLAKDRKIADSYQARPLHLGRHSEQGQGNVSYDPVFEFPIIWILGINTFLQPICHMISQKTIIQTYTKYKSTHTHTHKLTIQKTHDFIQTSPFHIYLPTYCHQPTNVTCQHRHRARHQFEGHILEGCAAHEVGGKGGKLS